MSDLPTRGKALEWAGGWDYTHEYLNTSFVVFHAYAGGTLQTRQEFIDSLDWEAMYETESQSRHSMPFSLLTVGFQAIIRDDVRALLMAALGEDTT